MKKLTALLILLTVVLGAGSGLIFAQNPAAVIREITGSIELKKSGSENWIPAKTGDIIEKSTIISTGFRSIAVISAGSSTLTVRPLTRLSLEEIMNMNETETINVRLNTGRVRVDVQPPAGKKSTFSVQSPTATASVRGTSFEMDTISIQVLSGSVSYAPSAGIMSRPVTVRAGQETWVDTETGSALIPMAAAEASHSIPNLPGQNTDTVNEKTARFNPPIPRYGSVDFVITLLRD